MLLVLCLLLDLHLVGAPAVGEETIVIGVSDLVALADHGVLQSRVEAERIWTALRASQLKPLSGQSPEEQEQTDAAGVAGAVRDLRRLLSLTNLLYCIATTLLTAVFTFLLVQFSKNHALQALLALGYGGIFVYWGLQLLAIGVVSDAAAEGSSGSQLIGGVLLMVPNIAAAAVGAAFVEIFTGLRWTELYHQWSSMQPMMTNVLTDNKFCLSCIVLAGSVMSYSGLLYKVSEFPLLLVPFFGSLYIVTISIGLLITKQAKAAVWSSIVHFLVLWCLAHSGLFSSDISLGLMISACNSGFWSFPYMLVVLPMIFGTGAGADAGQLRYDKASDLGSWVESELWTKPSFVVSLVCYALGNVAVMYYGLRIKSWVPLPYALIGVIVTMLLANHAPPRMRMAWRILYNLPMALLLFAASSAYGRITDTLWLAILSWLGQPHHFRIIGIFFVRGATLICATWSLWYGLSRLFPSRIVKDLKNQVEMLEQDALRLTEIREALATGPEKTEGLRKNLYKMFAKEADTSTQHLQQEALQAESNSLEASEETRNRKLNSLRSLIGKFEANGRLALGSIPMCWIGYCIVAAVCDVPEPFPQLAFVLNVNSLIYISRGFGGLILSAVGSGNGKFAEWKGDVPLKVALPVLLTCGVRVVALAEDSFLRNAAGVVLLGAGFTGLVRSNHPLLGTLLGSMTCVGIMIFGILCELRLLVCIGVICLYGLGIHLLLAQMCLDNIVSLVVAITALALGTMHLGMSYESYFLAMQKFTDQAIPLTGVLNTLVGNASIEKQMSLAIIRSIEDVFQL